MNKLANYVLFKNIVSPQAYITITITIRINLLECNVAQAGIFYEFNVSEL
jgi:hypothetical protein